MTRNRATQRTVRQRRRIVITPLPERPGRTSPQRNNQSNRLRLEALRRRERHLTKQLEGRSEVAL
jgi:hypothetical protein